MKHNNRELKSGDIIHYKNIIERLWYMISLKRLGYCVRKGDLYKTLVVEDNKISK